MLNSIAQNLIQKAAILASAVAITTILAAALVSVFEPTAAVSGANLLQSTLSVVGDSVKTFIAAVPNMI
jgi:hypothetical protein